MYFVLRPKSGLIRSSDLCRRSHPPITVARVINEQKSHANTFIEGNHSSLQKSVLAKNRCKCAELIAERTATDHQHTLIYDPSHSHK